MLAGWQKIIIIQEMMNFFKQFKPIQGSFKNNFPAFPFSIINYLVNICWQTLVKMDGFFLAEV